MAFELVKVSHEGKNLGCYVVGLRFYPEEGVVYDNTWFIAKEFRKGFHGGVDIPSSQYWRHLEEGTTSEQCSEHCLIFIRLAEEPDEDLKEQLSLDEVTSRAVFYMPNTGRLEELPFFYSSGVKEVLNWIKQEKPIPEIIE